MSTCRHCHQDAGGRFRVCASCRRERKNAWNVDAYARKVKPVRICSRCGKNKLDRCKSFCDDCMTAHRIERQKRRLAQLHESRPASDNAIGKRAVCACGCGVVFVRSVCNQKYAHDLTNAQRKAIKINAPMVDSAQLEQAEIVEQGERRNAKYKKQQHWSLDTQTRIDAIVRAASLPGYSARNPAPFVERVLEEMMV